MQDLPVKPPNATWLYLGFLAAFLGWNLWSPLPGKPGVFIPAPEINRWPVLAWTDGHVNLATLQKSIQRLPAVRGLRQCCHSLQLTVDQTPDWVLSFVHKGRATLLFQGDLVSAAGLTDANRAKTEQMVERIAAVTREFEAEQWTVIAVPIPPKLSILRARVSWPVRDLDLFSQQVIDRDRTDALMDHVFARLAAKKVASVDLRPAWRANQDRGVDIFPPGESHWTNAGLEIAAQAVAEEIGKHGVAMDEHPQVRAEFLPHVSDLADRLDMLPGWPRRYAKLRRFDETVARGGKAAVPPANIDAVVLYVGSSYGIQYTYFPDAGIVAALDRRLPTALLYNESAGARMPMESARAAVATKNRWLTRLLGSNAYPGLRADRKYLVWEFPLWEIDAFKEPLPAWVPAPASFLSRGVSPAPVVCGDGFYKSELLPDGTEFRWARQRAELTLRVAVAGRYRLRIRPATVFSKTADEMTIRVNGATNVVPVEPGDLLAATPQEINVELTAGENVVSLQTSASEKSFGASDPRTLAFALVWPLTVEPVP